MNPVEIIEQFYRPDSNLYFMLMEHNRRVTKKALKVAENVSHLKPDMQFIEEAAMLHDIGIFMTHVSALCCEGSHPYICHGYLGRELLEEKGLKRHALVCERHVGTGITSQDIEAHNLPLPKRDMLPATLEEEIIAYADKFYSKDCVHIVKEKTVDDVIDGLEKHGHEKAVIFQAWVEKFEGKNNG